MNAQAAIVAEFLAMWEVPGGFQRAVKRYFSNSTVYENIGISRTVGIEEACRFFEAFATDAGCEAVRVRMLAIAATEKYVLTERLDEILDINGNVLLSLPLMGIFEVHSGKLSAWRDYFDTGCMPAYRGPGAIKR